MKLSDYDKELLSLLEDEITDKTIIIHDDSEQFIKDIEKYYPFGFSGIDWEQKKSAYFIDIKKLGIEHKNKITKDFLEKITQNFPELSNEKIIVIGNNLTELSYEMTFNSFKKYHSSFFDIPQHTYVWFTFAKKCINLTFEDDLYFG